MQRQITSTFKCVCHAGAGSAVVKSCLWSALLRSNRTTCDPSYPAVQELLPDFRPVLEAYFDAMMDLGRRLMRLLALCLDLPPTWCAPARVKEA